MRRGHVDQEPAKGSLTMKDERNKMTHSRLGSDHGIRQMADLQTHDDFSVKVREGSGYG